MKYLIPVLAIVVVLESVVVVSRLTKKTGVAPIVETETDNNQLVEPVEADINFTLMADKTEIGVGQKSTVKLAVVSKEEMKLDAIDLLLKYDPTIVKVSALTEVGKLTATSKRVSEKTGNIVANFWSMDEKGYQLVSGEELGLISFTVEPLVAQDIEVSIVETAEMGSTKLVSTDEGKVVVHQYGHLPLVIKTTN